MAALILVKLLLRAGQRCFCLLGVISDRNMWVDLKPEDLCRVYT